MTDIEMVTVPVDGRFTTDMILAAMEALDKCDPLRDEALEAKERAVLIVAVVYRAMLSKAPKDLDHWLGDEGGAR